MSRCLIVEPSAVIRRVTISILSGFGFEVEEASNGRDGVAAFHRRIPRLVIVDAGLSDVPALDVLRQMRKLGSGRVQILYCTTQFDILELQRAHAAGATDLLIKPFDRQSLSAKLDAWKTNEQDGARENFYNRLSRSEIVRIG
jgi:two-component system chemotaxis response regulator CheY